MQNYSLDELFKCFEKKFKGVKYQKLHLLKSIVYFSDADNDPDPVMIESVDWENIKSELEEKVKSFSK